MKLDLKYFILKTFCLFIWDLNILFCHLIRFFFYHWTLFYLLGLFLFFFFLIFFHFMQCLLQIHFSVTSRTSSSQVFIFFIQILFSFSSFTSNLFPYFPWTFCLSVKSAKSTPSYSGDTGKTRIDLDTHTHIFITHFHTSKYTLRSARAQTRTPTLVKKKLLSFLPDFPSLKNTPCCDREKTTYGVPSHCTQLQRPGQEFLSHLRQTLIIPKLKILAIFTDSIIK